MPDAPTPAKAAPPPDPYADWTEEEKAEYAAGEKFRKRHAAEVADEIFERLFAEPEGGGTIGPDGKAIEPTPGAPGGAPPAHKAGVPWFDRPLFQRKPKAPPPAPPAKP
jgi:hypothetical protein